MDNSMCSRAQMTSFAWGLTPSSTRDKLVGVGGCSASDTTWMNNLALEAHPLEFEQGSSICTVEARTTSVPQLLINELVINLARRLLGSNNTIIMLPRAKVHQAWQSPQQPPEHWLVTLTACFPCDGTPVTRCSHVTALLDSRDIHKSMVLTATDAGVVPAEQATDGVLPFNAMGSELTVRR